ncbi:MAG: YidC/Oxa1 family rane protein insertase [Cryptosporangiaceae bacterium]|nr:YidC/Oxa1 family rane protein insertase [Cryptosporangiaceae bacterium]
MNLNWIYIAISWLLLKWHAAWAWVLGDSADLAWVLAIVFLVITARTILFPVFVKQIKSQRAMQTLQPQIKVLQEKHKGDKETLQREMMELYRREKANPLMGCLPMFLQIPVFLGLFHVLRLIDPTKPNNIKAMVHEYFWTEPLFKSAAGAKLFGAPIAAAFRSPDSFLKQEAINASGTTVKIVAAVLIFTMVATTYITQRQMIARTGKQADPTQAMIQKFMLYGVPASLLISGSLFPIGVVIYWVTTNLFSMGQQFWVLKHMPPPNTGAAGDKSKAVDPEVARALAPRPGVKPANPKKGITARPAAAQETAEPAPDVDDTPAEPGLNGRAKADAGSAGQNSGAGRRPQDARNRKRKGGRR